MNKIKKQTTGKIYDYQNEIEVDSTEWLNSVKFNDEDKEDITIDDELFIPESFDYYDELINRVKAALEENSPTCDYFILLNSTINLFWNFEPKDKLKEKFNKITVFLTTRVILNQPTHLLKLLKYLEKNDPRFFYILGGDEILKHNMETIESWLSDKDIHTFSSEVDNDYVTLLVLAFEHYYFSYRAESNLNYILPILNKLKYLAVKFQKAEYDEFVNEIKNKEIIKILQLDQI